MAKSPERVCEKYAAKLELGRMLGRADGDVKSQVEHFRQGVERMETLRQMMSQVLCAAGISTIWFPYYYDFGRKLMALSSRTSSAEVLLLEARMQLEVWVARGLERAVLEQIAENCFNLKLSGPIPSLAERSGPT